MSTSFVHLRLHTEYSLVDGTVRIKSLIGATADAGMPAVTVTDDTNLFGLVKFYQAARSRGLKPIFGCDLYLRDDDELPCLVTVIAQTDKGYANLRSLISKAWLEGQYQGRAYVTRDWIKHHAEGLIVMSGARYGDVGRALVNGNPAQARELANWWLDLVGDRYYLELQRTDRSGDEDYVHAAVALASELSIPVVATNDVRFIKAEEFDAHEVRVCIASGRALDDPRRQRSYSREQYLKSPDEMAALFADIPEAISNTVEIARRCTVNIEIGTYYLPDFPVPDGLSMAEFFRQLSHDGLTQRLDFLFPSGTVERTEKEPLYRDRLEFEIETILGMGFPGYFLIVMDFIRWAKEHAIPVGPGRGSGAGSLVAYALEITDLDPLEYDLLFERFLNPERVSMPDFDVDFCMENRDKVIGYVADTYGRESVSQIITFGTLAAKAAIRDVARALGKSYGLADKLSKMIPFEPGMTLDKAFEVEEVLREFLDGDEQAQEIWDMAKQLEGVARNVGTHAGGVVIAPDALTDFSPLYTAGPGEGIVTQFDKSDVEEVGLVKFDFLGLRTLTIIDWAIQMIDRRRKAEGEEPLDIMAIPLDDPDTFRLLQDGQTTAVFQLESRGMKDLIRRLKPNSFEDLVALVALFRPGPLQSGMVDDFINRKHGRAEVAYPHPTYQHDCLKPILEPTYGIILYQEQVMQIAQAMGGYSLGGADLLRRAMGKKKPEEMVKQRVLFMEGAGKMGFEKDLASNIFDLMEKFAGYGFNKSHSAAYALVSYQTAWLKTHYPAEFMAATMSSDMDKTDKVVTFMEECRETGLDVEPPNVNSGEFHFSVDGSDKIIYGLGAIKGLGEGPVESILEARSGANFTDLFDFCNRIESRKVNKRAIEALIRSGAFDTLKVERSILDAAIGDAVKAAEQNAHNVVSGIDDMFGDVSQSAAGDVYQEFRSIIPWSSKERLEGEKDTLGLYISGHPIDEYLDELAQFTSDRISELRAGKSSQTIAGLVISNRVLKTKRGLDMAVTVIDDRSGRIEMTIFSEELARVRDKLANDTIVVVEGMVAQDDRDGGLKMRVNRLSTLAEARAARIQAIALALNHDDFSRDFPARLTRALGRFKGGECPLWVEYRAPDASGRVRLGADWQLTPDDDCLATLKQHFGAERVTVVYHRQDVGAAVADTTPG